MEDKVTRRIGRSLYGAATVTAIAFGAWRWIVAAELGAASLPMGGIRFRATMWAAALVTGGLYLVLLRQGAGKALGITLLSVPLWGAFLGFLNSIPDLRDGGSVLRALTPYELSTRYIRGILYDLSYLGAGFLLWARPELNFRSWARKLRKAGFLTGAGEGRSAFVGYVVFPLVLLGAWSIDWFINNVTPQLINGDESMVWQNMTLWHATMISLAAAFTEELVYRVVALGMFTWLAGRAGLGTRSALAVGIGGQALLFAGAHGGYGTWAHVVYPGIFALLMGVLVLYAGVWAAVVIHFLIDFYVFGSEVGAHDAAVNTFLWTTLWINAAATLGWMMWASLRWLRGTPPWRGFLAIPGAPRNPDNE